MKFNPRIIGAVVISLLTISLAYSFSDYVDPRMIITNNKGQKISDIIEEARESRAIYYVLTPTCRYCHEQVKDIPKIKSRFPDVDNVLVMWSDNEMASKMWVSQHSPELFDKIIYKNNDEFVHKLGVYAVPHAIIVNNGEIQLETIGMLTNGIIKNHIGPSFSN